MEGRDKIYDTFRKQDRFIHTSDKYLDIAYFKNRYRESDFENIQFLVFEQKYFDI